MATAEQLVYPWQRTTFASVASEVAAGRLPHALIVTGVEGQGLSTFAHALAVTLLCERRSSEGACGACRSCRLVEGGTHPDYLRVGPESMERPVIKVDQIRELIEALTLASHSGVGRVATIEAADTLNLNAANSLLKTLEEPPPGVTLILTATAATGLPATIRSRCRILSLLLPDEREAGRWLEDQGRPDAVPLLALSGGAPLRALSMADAGAGDQLRQLRADLEAALQQPSSATGIASRWQGQGAEAVVSLVAYVLMDAMRFKATGEEAVRLPGMGELARLVAARDWEVLYEYSDELVALRRALEQPLNETLAMERLFLGWAQTIGGAAPANA